MFDVMPERFWDEGSKKAAMANEEDCISALPDAILQYVLSFLPSRQAVWTCVLARRWRHQWKSVPALRINDVDSFPDVEQLNRFVQQLLLRRDWAPLHECEIDSYDGGHIAWWYQYAVSCDVPVLQVDTAHASDYLRLSEVAITSEHLARLDLGGVKMEACSLDFSSCPALEVLKMDKCIIKVEKILSQSIRRLSITRCSFKLDTRTRISTPTLVYFELADHPGRTPLLESMPSLATAFIRLGEHCEDYCIFNYYGDCGDDHCGIYCTESSDVHGDDCVLVGGLSNVTDLELLAEPEVFIFRRDLKMCPSFSKLKTLLLNVWYVDADVGPLVYFLRHSPILEKLTLQLYMLWYHAPKGVPETDESCNEGEFLASKHIKVVEVKYYEDGVLPKILKLLTTYGVPPEKINSEQINLRSSQIHFQKGFQMASYV